MILAFTGHRDESRLAPGWEMAWTLRLADPAIRVVRLGGALGADTIALAYAGAVRNHLAATHRPGLFRIELYATDHLGELPQEAAVEANLRIDTDRGDRVVNLRLVSWGGLPWKPAYLKRNTAMLLGRHRADTGQGWAEEAEPATALWAVWDGGEGGTAHCVGEARRLGIPVETWGAA